MQIPDKDYITVSGFNSIGGGIGQLAVRIQIAGSNLPKKMPEAVRFAAYRAEEEIRQDLTAAIIAADPEKMQAAAEEKAELLNLFMANSSIDAIYVEEIPNGYCSQGCCRHKPWFIVTTSVGRFKIGWRKRVINIDWSDTVKETWEAEELFPKEGVTKGGKYIHAWDYAKAKKYVAAIVASALTPKPDPNGTTETTD